MVDDSSRELLDSINALRKSMDSMLKLFTEASKDFSVEEKLDEIINQNKAIMDKLAILSNSTSYSAQKRKPQQSLNFPKPSFQPAPEQNFQQPPGFQQSFSEPKVQELDELPEFKELNEPPRPQRQGPIAMPSVPFSSIREPKKRGMFGRLKR